MKNNHHYFLLLLLIFLSCNRYPKGVEEALKLAGDNRPELEKVLNHYKMNPADSLKYKAACFLIESMPEYFSYSGLGPEAFRDKVKDFAKHHNYLVSGPHLRIVPTTQFDDKFTIPVFEDLEKVYDIHIMTSEYLTENIDLAFEAWLKAPWSSTIDFSSFCEYILPYRTGNEPLRNWRRKYRETFLPILDSLLKNDDPVEAGKILYDSICHTRWIFDNQVTPLYIDALHLFDCRVGDCRLLADYATFVFRSVGIASGIDLNLQNPKMLYQSHYWNFLKDNSGKTIPFELYQTEVSQETGKIGVTKGKVYRMHFNKQKLSHSLRYKKTNLPQPLDNAYLTDVSADYFEGIDIEYQIDNQIEADDNLLYLGVFNNRTWIPVTVTKIEKGKAIFYNMEPGIVYQALYTKGELLLPISVPVLCQENGRPYFLTPDKKNVQPMSLDRKYPFPVWMDEFKHRSNGGKFQGANRSDFSDATTLFTTTNEFDLKYHRIAIHNQNKFRYLRYCSAIDSRNNMAELQFFGTEGCELTGKVIGTEGTSIYIDDHTKYAVFDKNPVSFFDAIQLDTAWVGLELDKSMQVTEIEFLFRNDDNAIREGDIYELFYFSDKGFISQGKRTGVKNGTLFFDQVPSNALYLLHNHTRGREERPFTYEDGKQIWW